ncbi:1-phosphofructokinase family hexose kinase [Spirochaeta cellobiosiphila]|uniref:1-phosphofructokinase family hexose kinase n=1 Tax=Spirochaeta cellobiosiphila TaxID=504483 RepID=UPI0003FF632E|nr:PfkB family carbohydrate kinase [Spirochaeta cellobiosiphila]
MKVKPILTVGLNPAIQKILIFDKWCLGKVNRSDECHYVSAGKSINVSRVLTQAGVPNIGLSPLGEINLKQWFQLQTKDQLNIIHKLMPGLTRTCTTIIDRSTNIVTEIVADESYAELTDVQEELKREYKQLIPHISFIVLAGSKQKGFDDLLYTQLVQEAKRKGVPILADYKGDDLRASLIDKEIRPDVVKINHKEILSTFSNTTSIEDLIRELSFQYNNSFIITREEKSVLVATCGVYHEVPVPPLQNIINPIGCGDAMTAGLAQALSCHKGLPTSLQQGLKYARLNAQSLYPGWIKV